MYVLSYEPPPAALTSWPTFPGSGGIDNNGTNNGTIGDPGLELPDDWSSLIGIVTAIVGNMLIALALNVQRYAHIQLDRRRQENRERARQALKNAPNGGGSDVGSYGSVGGHHSSSDDDSDRGENRPVRPIRSNDLWDDDDTDDASESQPLAASFHSSDSPRSRWMDTADVETDRTASVSPDSGKSQSTSYLRSPYWWLGQVLITVGEMGNFLAYGFAPASIVSPLGVVALISNCVIAPILFKEHFRLQDFWGVVIAVAGAVTVVLSAKQQETKLAPHDVWDAITTPAFEIYVAVTCGLIALFMWASPRYGHRTILIDLGLVGLFGAYTVLATKGVSSMLSSTLFGAFMTPMTYTLLFILLSTAVMQVRYVNKALQRFDSTQVIPIQFVMFTLSVIVGSAVLYRDFERTTREQALKFIGGCLLTFFGVFIITSGRPPAAGDDDSENSSDIEGEAVLAAGGRVGESINLSSPQAHGDVHAHMLSPGATAHRSSRPVRAGSLSSVRNKSSTNSIKPFPLLSVDSGVPSHRVPSSVPSSVPGVSVLATSDSEDDARMVVSPHGEDAGSLLENPWRGPTDDVLIDTTSTDEEAGELQPPQRPALGMPTVSADPVLQTASGTVGPSRAARGGERRTSVTGAEGAGSLPPLSLVTTMERPVTPPRPAYLSHFQSPMISPSPLLSSAVGTVVADTILKHMDGTSGNTHTARRMSNRRMRQGLRSSLFVPQDELDAEWLMQPFDTAGEGAGEAMMTAATSSKTSADEGRAGETSQKAGRDRRRSLSSTLGNLGHLGNLFRTGRSRRNTNPDAEVGRLTRHSSRTEQDDYAANDDPLP